MAREFIARLEESFGEDRAFIKYIFERWGMLPFLYVFFAFLVMSLIAMGLGTLGWCRAFDYPPFTLFSPTTCSATFVNERRISEEKDRIISSLKLENEAVGAENEELKSRLRSGAADDVAALRSELVRQRKMKVLT